MVVCPLKLVVSLITSQVKPRRRRGEQISVLWDRTVRGTLSLSSLSTVFLASQKVIINSYCLYLNEMARQSRHTPNVRGNANVQSNEVTFSYIQ